MSDNAPRVSWLLTARCTPQPACLTSQHALIAVPLFPTPSRTLVQTARMELSRLESRRHELMGRVGTLQSQLASLVEEEEGLLRQQLDGEPLRPAGPCTGARASASISLFNRA